MSKNNSCVLTTANASITPAALPESSFAEVSATGEGVGFTVLGEVKPRTLKKVNKIGYLLVV